jgi:pSer/pThr/pTyr-binding forkhead associated (FHA) protein/ribosomal protein L40E
MIPKVSDQFCPVCKHKNPINATVCNYCGYALKSAKKGATTQIVADKGSLPPEEAKHGATGILIPENGVALYIPDHAQPIAIRAEEKITLGRKLEQTQEDIIDLTPYGAFIHGVSRWHATINLAEGEYEVTDLNSTNGTWLNEQKLTPLKPYSLPSGSMLRLGKLRLLVMYKITTKKE